MKNHFLVFGVLALLTVARTSDSHHSTAVDFDKNAATSIEGVITATEFANPHSRLYIDVVAEDGTTVNWQIETRPPSGLAGFGITPDTVTEGVRVRVDGEPSRRGRNSMWLTGLTIGNGPRIAVVDGDVAQPQQRRQIVLPGEWTTFSESAASYRGDAPFDISGGWSGRYKFSVTVDDLEPKPMPATAEALRLRAENQAFGTDDALRCIGTGLPRIFGSPGTVDIFDQGPFLLFVYGDGGSAIVRRIYMDGRTAPEDWPLTMYGYSAGRWEGDALVIETSHLKPMWLDGSGWPMSGADTRLVETYAPSNDGATLERTMTVHDPLYTEPLVRTRGYMRTDGAQQESICDPQGFYRDLLNENLITEYLGQ